MFICTVYMSLHNTKLKREFFVRNPEIPEDFSFLSILAHYATNNNIFIMQALIQTLVILIIFTFVTNNPNPKIFIF